MSTEITDTSDRDATKAIPDRIPSDSLIRQVATELDGLSTALERFQHDLSDLLIEADVSPRLMTRAQLLDGATQSLHALAAVAFSLAEVGSDTAYAMTSQDLERLVPLGDLRLRLMGGERINSGAPETGHVNLF